MHRPVTVLATRGDEDGLAPGVATDPDGGLAPDVATAPDGGLAPDVATGPDGGCEPPVTAALPVSLRVEGPHADEVRRWVEGVLGWQPIDEATARLVPPLVELVGPALVGERAPGSPPRVLLIDDEVPSLEAARAAACAGTRAVVGWPSGREELAGLVEGLLAAPAATTGTRVLRVGGAGGGVGTTTVALALAGLSAWSGARALAAVRGTGLRLRGLPGAALAGPDLWSRADELAGLTTARAVRLTDAAPPADPTDPTLDVLVVDAGADADVDVLVCRPDAAAMAVLPTTTAGAVVIVGEGPARLARLRDAAAGRRPVLLPWSVRVARAGLTNRVPAGLPGAWLRRLAPLAPHAPTRRTADR